MIQITPQMRILVAVEPTDFRRGIDGLARVCKEVLRHDPFNGWVFVFRNRPATALKILVYDGQGFWLCHKRLSRGKFSWWPRQVGGPDVGGPRVAGAPGGRESRGHAGSACLATGWSWRLMPTLARKTLLFLHSQACRTDLFDFCGSGYCVAMTERAAREPPPLHNLVVGGFCRAS